MEVEAKIVPVAPAAIDVVSELTSLISIAAQASSAAGVVDAARSGVSMISYTHWKISKQLA
jgi:hypothetical protein